MRVCDDCRGENARTKRGDYCIGKGHIDIKTSRELCDTCAARLMLAYAVMLLQYDGARRLLEELDEDYKTVSVP